MLFSKKYLFFDENARLFCSGSLEEIGIINIIINSYYIHHYVINFSFILLNDKKFYSKGIKNIKLLLIYYLIIKLIMFLIFN